MSKNAYVLNDTFWVYPQLGLIKQKSPAKETAIEPRLMNLLCLLIFNNGEIVGPAKLAKKVLVDYEHSIEAIIKSVSFLRKVLNDEHGRMIESVPKQGYVLHARITDQKIEEKR
jgi:DNA-binding winged helix-turn-helix (wHTH) protein